MLTPPPIPLYKSILSPFVWEHPCPCAPGRTWPGRWACRGSPRHTRLRNQTRPVVEPLGTKKRKTMGAKAFPKKWRRRGWQTFGCRPLGPIHGWPGGPGGSGGTGERGASGGPGGSSGPGGPGGHKLRSRSQGYCRWVD